MRVPWTDRLPQRARVVEIGVGARWSTAIAVLGARPDLRLSATDVHRSRLADPPPGVTTFLDDVTDPDVERYRGVDLLYAVRCPEELQVPIARLSARVGSGLALRALKDEWVSLEGLLGPAEQMGGGQGASWRVWGLGPPGPAARR